MKKSTPFPNFLKNFQFRTKGNGSGGVDSVKFDNVGSPLAVRAGDRPLAEDGVADPEAHGKARLRLSVGKPRLSGADVRPGLADEPLPGREGVGEELGVDVQHEAGGIPGRAVQIPPLGLGKIEPLFRPCHRHEGKPPLLLHFRPCVRLFGGKDPLVHGRQEDVRELQPLGGVDGHELHLVPAVHGVLVGEKGDMRQIALQRPLLPAGDLEIVDRLLELRQVIEPLLASLGPQHPLVAGVVEDGGQQLRDGPRPALDGVGVDEGDELPGLRGLDELLVQVGLQRGIEGTAVLGGVLAQKLQPPPAQVPLGRVAHPQEGEVVLVGRHAQVGKGILDLPPVKKLHAAVDGIRDSDPLEDLLDGPGHEVGAVEDRHVPVGRALLLVEPRHLPRHPGGLLVGGLRAMDQHAGAGGERRRQVLLDTGGVFVDEGVGAGQDLRRGAVIFRHEDGPRAGVFLIEVQKIPDVRASPGVDGLVRVPHDEEVLVVARQHLHELVLEGVDVLELVDHDVLKPLLPLELYILVLPEDVERELDEVVIIQGEALLLLVEVAVKNDVLGGCGGVVLLLEAVQGEAEHVLVVVRALEKLLDLDHVPGIGEGHVPEGEAPFLVDDLEHLVDVRVVQHQEALGIPHGADILLQDRDAKAVEGADVPRVVVAGEVVDALAHLGGGLVGEGDAQNVGGQDAQLVHQVRESVGQGSRLPGPRPGDDPHRPLGRRHRLPLRPVQPLQKLRHIPTSFLFYYTTKSIGFKGLSPNFTLVFFRLFMYSEEKRGGFPMKSKLSSRRGWAGWLIIALVLALAVTVGVFITLTHRDKERERDRAVKYVTTLVTEKTQGCVPTVETQVLHDYGEHVLLAARYKLESEGRETISGSYLLDISDLSQQIYHISEEYPYDHDFTELLHLQAREWGII